eukprot:gene7883-1408_t
MYSLLIFALPVVAEWLQPYGLDGHHSYTKEDSSSLVVEAFDPDTNAVVLLYLPWCEHCHKLWRGYEELATSFLAQGTTDVKFLALDATDDAAQPLLEDFQLKGTAPKRDRGAHAHGRSCSSANLAGFPKLIWFARATDDHGAFLNPGDGQDSLYWPEDEPYPLKEAPPRICTHAAGARHMLAIRFPSPTPFVFPSQPALLAPPGIVPSELFSSLCPEQRKGVVCTCCPDVGTPSNVPYLPFEYLGRHRYLDAVVEEMTSTAHMDCMPVHTQKADRPPGHHSWADALASAAADPPPTPLLGCPDILGLYLETLGRAHNDTSYVEQEMRRASALLESSGNLEMAPEEKLQLRCKLNVLKSFSGLQYFRAAEAGFDLIDNRLIVPRSIQDMANRPTQKNHKLHRLTPVVPDTESDDDDSDEIGFEPTDL